MHGEMQKGPPSWRALLHLHALLSDDGFGLDLHEHVRVDERPDFDHGCCRKDGREEFSVHSSDGFPPTDVRDVDPRANDVLEACPRALQRRLDIHQCLTRLNCKISNANELPGGIRGCGTGYVHDPPDSNGS